MHTPITVDCGVGLQGAMCESRKSNALLLRLVFVVLVLLSALLTWPITVL